MPTSVDSSRAFRGVPSFIRAICRTASDGGASGYSEAGWHLMYHVRDLEPLAVEADEWEIECDKLDELVRADQDDEVLRWFAAWYPKVMTLIPRRRRRSFLEGVKRRAAQCAGYSTGAEWIGWSRMKWVHDQLSQKLPLSIALGRWRIDCAQLMRLINERRGNEVFQWFVKQEKDVSLLVASDDRESFLAGVYRCAAEFGFCKEGGTN